MKRERRAGRVKGYYANHEKRFALPAQTCHDILVIRPAQGTGLARRRVMALLPKNRRRRASAGLRGEFPRYENATLDLGAYDPVSLTFF